MTSISDLKNLPTPPPTGYQPGIEWDGHTGHVTVATTGQQPDKSTVDGVIDSSPYLDSSEIQVDWAAKPRVSIHHDADGNVVQAWYKLPLVKRIDRSFEIDELLEGIYAKPAVFNKTGNRWRTIMLSDQHIGKSKQDGGGADVLIERWKRSVTNALADGPFEGINLVFGGDTIEGYVSQGGKNIAGCDMTLSEQIRVASHLVIETIQQCIQAANHVVVATVPGNHGETTRVSNVSMTDSHDIQVVSAAQQAIELAGLGETVDFYYPQEGTGDVTYAAGDTTFTVVHGHRFSGGAVKGAETWWSGQITNDRPAAASDVLLFGHFHGFRAWSYTARRWILSAPALETQSTWVANSFGGSSTPGALVFDIRDGKPVNIGVM
ncbi:hypothetical protein HMPREF3166_01470 [Corynebacterium sp. HMSC08A12]|uniref:hypothetical protein n=1 Tax=Corynebacterium sp. HMSC08A12 TaxID=1581134 RepID=UPI0008A3754D|nr:hypothetical protein [Corynebacterium sp. HMSC08A12]OFT36218.1 hypothetical protein HMPREF3166_01470 [Corynebacterium sp. HMSC08A12]